jgi:hypothetical protein
VSGSEEQRDARGDEVGSLGEETAKLLGALAGWAREQDLAGHVAAFTEAEVGSGPQADGEAGADEAGRVGAASVGAGAVGAGSVGAGGEESACECRYCPLCRGVHAVRHLSPEVRTHLVAAVSSLARAAEAVLRTDAPAPSRPEGVERIDLDGWDEPGERS